MDRPPLDHPPHSQLAPSQHITLLAAMMKLLVCKSEINVDTYPFRSDTFGHTGSTPPAGVVLNQNRLLITMSVSLQAMARSCWCADLLP
jgi:hypothetical protein